MPEFESHDKVEACGHGAVGLVALGLSYAVRALPDGVIPDGWAESKTREEAGGSAAQQLVDEGLWEPVEGGYRVHDFAVYNPTRAEIEDRRQRERERKRRQRRRPTGTVPPGQKRPTGTASSIGRDPLGAAVCDPSPASQPGPTAPGDGGTMGGSTSTSTSTADSARSSSADERSATDRSAKRARDEFDLET